METRGALHHGQRARQRTRTRAEHASQALVALVTLATPCHGFLQAPHPRRRRSPIGQTLSSTLAREEPQQRARPSSQHQPWGCPFASTPPPSPPSPPSSPPPPRLDPILETPSQPLAIAKGLAQARQAAPESQHPSLDLASFVSTNPAPGPGPSTATAHSRRRHVHSLCCQAPPLALGRFALQTSRPSRTQDVAFAATGAIAAYSLPKAAPQALRQRGQRSAP